MKLLCFCPASSLQSALNTSLEHPDLADQLRRKQNELSTEWDHLQEEMRRSLTQMIQMHR
ncbi:hypothetical protein CRM22_003102, partial [Opisthorchis felineus]